MCKWTNDTQRFLLEHYDVICNSPSQIYHFSLPFSPPSSWLYKHYAAEFSNEVKVVKGGPVEWGRCFRTVFLDVELHGIACWNNSIAVCIKRGNIVILNGITGSQAAILSGHTKCVNSVTFSSDGTLVVSGSDDETVKVWDVQTGGIVKTFCGHKNRVQSVSISVDSTIIASGDWDGMIFLWDTEIWECHCVIKQKQSVSYVQFSPTDPKYFISVSGYTVWQWETNGCKTGLTYDGSLFAFSPDGTQCVLCSGTAVTVQYSNSRVTIAEFNAANSPVWHCCFSPDGRLVAAATQNTIYVLDVTSSDPNPIEPFIRQTSDIIGLSFSSPSTIISLSQGGSVKFWQIGVSLIDPVISDQNSIPPASPSVESISLKARDGVVISSDKKGVLKIWDILTGHCKTSFQTPASYNRRDVQLIDGKLIFVWHEGYKIYICDVRKSKLLQTLKVPSCGSLKISGDGSKIFSLANYTDGTAIHAWSTSTGEPMGSVELEDRSSGNFFCLEGSKIWVKLESSLIQGWEFGASDSSPIPLPEMPTERSHLEFVDGPPRIKDKVTGKFVFQLFGKYANPRVAQWDGQYLVAGYWTGEVLILDFCHLYPQQQSVVYCLCVYDPITSIHFLS